ncbi:glycosyltransferase family protein [Butyrivibrio sp. WCD2001]|uniref:glycosyltransferase family protein n=1 Tax=Butyrivibrio sp. WCD2001 TaxID=1280681 RepID=UPI00041CFCE5|nr:glycosyltransferase [Butyrivibrio sp. WCD2001]
MSDNREKELFEQSIHSIQTFAEKGYINEAFKMLEALEKAYPGKRQELLWNKVWLQEKCGDAKNIILSLFELYDFYNDENAYELIEESFFIPQREQLESKYKTNKKIVENYNMFFGNVPESPAFFVLYHDDEMVVILDKNKKKLYGWTKDKINIDAIEKSALFLEGALFCKQIEEIADRVKPELSANGFELAIYLVFSEWEFEAFLQIANTEKLIKYGRYVFLVEKEGIYQCFKDSEFELPGHGYSLNGRKLTLHTCFHDILDAQNQRKRELSEEVKRYYKENVNEVNERVKVGKPRILFSTSRFSTVLQYHARNAMEAARKLGCECELSIETENIKRVTPLKQMELFMEFKPDAIFVLDHFRFEERGFFPDEIYWITWIQDPMNHIIDSETYKKLGKKDMVINHFISWDWLKELYHGKLIDAPIPSNQDIYKPYELTNEELDLYSTDICLVCHSSDVEKWIDDFLNGTEMDEEIKIILREILNLYFEDAKRGEFLYNKADFATYIKDGFACKNMALNDLGIEYLAEQMYMWFNQRVFRQVLVDWLLDAGFENIKLWGNGWKNSPKYEKYAMGPAENGVTLSKIYQASKIVVGNNIMTTAAARAWESMFSGAFYLSNYIPKGDDLVDINLIMPEGTVEFFEDKEELIEKIRYYLEHEDERKKMAEIGRGEALKRMTFDALMEKVIGLLPEYV